MTSQERKSMRRDQVERCLSADMTIKDWCALNKVPESTMYSWMARFREEDPGMLGKPNASEWIELTRESIAGRTALARRGDAAPPETAPRPVPPTADASSPAHGAAVVVRMGGADVIVPEGASGPHVAFVLRAVASL